MRIHSGVAGPANDSELTMAQHDTSLTNTRTQLTLNSTRTKHRADHDGEDDTEKAVVVRMFLQVAGTADGEGQRRSQEQQ